MLKIKHLKHVYKFNFFFDYYINHQFISSIQVFLADFSHLFILFIISEFVFYFVNCFVLFSQYSDSILLIIDKILSVYIKIKDSADVLVLENVFKTFVKMIVNFFIINLK